ncbi:MAG: hypothetical protein J6I69_03100 [Bacilli bacterium]|jgi:hypothetical protein|nr:hypothetical protein [Bacilli bacterium]
MQDRETRVRRYAELRDQIDRMDTLSFDDPNREERYGLNGKKEDGIDYVHEEPTSEDLSAPHIKKNTLSISIEDLIKQNDDYTVALEKKELDKKYHSIKKKKRKEGRSKWLIVALAALVVLIVVGIILISLHAGGKL